jgi:hypothetical protein
MCTIDTPVRTYIQYTESQKAINIIETLARLLAAIAIFSPASPRAAFRRSERGTPAAHHRRSCLGATWQPTATAVLVTTVSWCWHMVLRRGREVRMCVAQHGWCQKERQTIAAATPRETPTRTNALYDVNRTWHVHSCALVVTEDKDKRHFLCTRGTSGGEHGEGWQRSQQHRRNGGGGCGSGWRMRAVVLMVAAW